MPVVRNSNNLREAIDSIDISGGISPPTFYNQMNPSVKSFLAEVTYDPSDYSYSKLADYVVDTDHDKAKPFGVTVDIPSAGTLTLQDGTKNTSYNVSAGVHVLYNITPSSTGSYIVRDSSDCVSAAGLLKPTGSLRMIYASVTNNIRDLGGWTCDGGTVKYGKLFRGGEIGAEDAELFHDLLGIRAELNLRWDSEVRRTYSLIGSDVDFKHISGPWTTTGRSTNWPSDAHKQILNYIMDNAIIGKPLYFHCAAGADRTGTAAFLVESLLGMSQSDTDKDYELTSFYTGVDTDAHARRRDESEWVNFMNEFNSYPGTVMRDKVVNWALSIGITIEKINAFRTAMIDGTPEILTGDVGSVNITRSITGAATDNTANTSAMYQPYIAHIAPDNGKVLTSVRVTMGGTDITNKVFSGDETVYRYAVGYALTNCTLLTDPKRISVVAGECFCCELQANEGYSLNDDDEPTILITMGGQNMSNYYKNGVINIPRVTGDIAIRVSAAASAPSYTNQIADSAASISGSELYNGTGYKDGYRYNSGMAEATQTGQFTTGYIHLKTGDVVRFYGNVISGANGGANSAFYKENGSIDAQFTHQTFSSGSYATGALSTRISSVDYDTTAHVLHSFVWSANYDVWVKFTLLGSFVEDTTVITVNEEM